MLTAKFRPEEAVSITPPTSISEKPLPAEKGTITISVAPDGKIFLGVDDKEAQQMMLERMAGNDFRVLLPCTYDRRIIVVGVCTLAQN